VTDSPIAVLDIDGTLIDSNYQHGLAWYRALRLVDETYPVWRLHRLIGMGGDQVVMALGGADLERRVGDQVREQQGKEVDALLEEMMPLPGCPRPAGGRQGTWSPAGAGQFRPAAPRERFPGQAGCPRPC
jgi:phosphoglycolate phosphatase-like HAD superfamily hydrolase